MSYSELRKDAIQRLGKDDPTEEEIGTEINVYTNTHHTFNREVAYPSLEEQADMQYWDAINGTTTWIDTISAIKLKYPKENN
jgi:hypothetical protein